MENKALQTINANPVEFMNRYKLIGSVELYKAIGDQKCRFCGESKDEQFATTTHLVPELLGENDFVSTDECDLCNSKFSKYESHLAILARPFLAMTNVKTKAKTPIFQSRTDFPNQQRSTLKIEKETGARVFNGNIADISFNKTKSIYSLTFRNPGFRPLFVYKALCKIAIGLMPPELIMEYPELTNWLLEKVELSTVPHGFQTKLRKKIFLSPSAMLYQLNKDSEDSDKYLEFVGIICFANTVIQFFLPETNLNLHSDTTVSKRILVYPAVLFDGLEDIKIKTTITHMDLGNPGVYKYDEVFTMVGKPHPKNRSN